MTGSGEWYFLDVGDEEDTGSKANCSNNIRNNSVLPNSIRHELEDDDTHAQDDKVGNKSKGVSEVVEFILNSKNITLLFLEQVREGTRLM